MNTAHGNGALLAGVFCLVAGLLTVLAATRVIPVAESQFQAPRWVVSLAGLVFVLGGVAILSPWWAAGHQGRSRASHALQFLCAAFIITLFAVIANWIAFGSGDRDFEGGVSLPLLNVFFPEEESVGRLVFGISAVILDVLAVVIWAHGARRFWGTLTGVSSGQR